MFIQMESRNATIRRLFSTATVFCCLAMLTITFAAPIQGPTVDNPCQVDPRASLEFLPLLDQLKSALTEINAASALLQTVADQIAAAGLTPAEVTALKASPSPVPGLPVKLNSTGSVNATAKTTVLTQDYTNTSIHILYVMMATSEQTTYDSGRLVPELQSAKATLFSILCKNDMVLRSLNSRVTTFVNASVVPVGIQNMDLKKTYKRNYLMVTQSKSYVIAMGTYYRMLIEAVSVGR